MKTSQRPQRTLRAANGFTLIEIMVALGIFMVLGLLSYRALSSIIESRDRVGREQLRWQSVTRFMQRLEIDLQQIPRGVPEVVVYDAGRQTLRLIRLVPNALGDEVRTIRYRWQNGRIERDERKLFAPALAKDLPELIEPEVALEQVQEVAWLWPAAQTPGAAMAWQAPPTGAAALPPAAIQLRLQLDDVAGEIKRTVALQ